MRALHAVRRSDLAGSFILIAALLTLLFVPQSAEDAAAPEAIACWADISYPIELRVIAESPVHPGATVNARIEVESRLALADVSLRIDPPTTIDLLTPARLDLGKLAANELRTERVSLRLPQSTERRTVEVTVSGWTDRFELRRSAILNLLPGGGEPFRLITTPDGRRVREVRARRAD